MSKRIFFFTLLAVLFCTAVYAQELFISDTALHMLHEGVKKELSVREVTGYNTYLTSVSAAPWDTCRLLVATTFHGLFESQDCGESWRQMEELSFGLSIFYRGSGFYADIAAAAYDETAHDILWVELSDSGNIIAVNVQTQALTELSDMRGRQALHRAVRAASPSAAVMTAARIQRMKTAADHQALYIHAGNTSRLSEYVQFSQEHGFTAVVVDFKDDNGRIVYDSQLALPRAANAVHPVFDVSKLIAVLHEAGLYVIARVVVFKDKALSQYDGHKYAVWDRKRNAPWGVFRQSSEGDLEQVEYWTDMYAPEVKQYTIDIAKELEELGVDEIQFDYIRTPSDGDTRAIVYRYQTVNSPYAAVQELVLFLQQAREALHIPIGVDVFGFNAWYRTSYLGQDVMMLAQHVDVISPMLYPSHFPRAFEKQDSYEDWAEHLYHQGVSRLLRITQGSVVVRPYVQAFLIGKELQFEEAQYMQYLQRQIVGAEQGGGSGYILWNASGNYYMVAGQE